MLKNVLFGLAIALQIVSLLLMLFVFSQISALRDCELAANKPGYTCDDRSRNELPGLILYVSPAIVGVFFIMQFLSMGLFIGVHSTKAKVVA